MPHDAVTVRQDVVEKTTFGGHDAVLLTKYEAPATPDSGYAPDVHRAHDEHCCRVMMTILNTSFPPEYRGFWATRHDGAQKFAGVGMPILMGVNNWIITNLKTHDLTPGRVIASGAEILERYGLSRVRFSTGEFFDARQKHSALVVPSRRVPV